jgi:hypothetical protein
MIVVSTDRVPATLFSGYEAVKKVARCARLERTTPPRSSDSSSLNQLDEKTDHCYDQQKVDESSKGIGAHHPQNPEDQKHNE